MNKILLKNLEKIKENDPFLVTITTFNKDKTAKKDLDTFLFVNDFPSIELEGTKKMIIKLIDDMNKKKK